MLLVAVADTHLYHDELRVPAGDVFVHAGDLLRAGTLDELRRATEWLTSLPHRHKVLVAGNHDRCFELQHAEAIRLLPGNIHYLQDEGVLIGGLRFWGSPWQPAYNGWAFNLERGRKLRSQWARIPTNTDILVTHGPPLGFGDRSPVHGRHGCVDLAARVSEIRPLLHVFGHIHQDGGFWHEASTAYLNATTWECERGPSVVDLSPDGEVVPVTIPPREADF